MAVFPFQYVNRRGIPVITTTGVNVTTENVVFTFPNHACASSMSTNPRYHEFAKA